MSDLTKKAIKDSFRKLLQERPLTRITFVRLPPTAALTEIRSITIIMISRSSWMKS